MMAFPVQNASNSYALSHLVDWAIIRAKSSDTTKQAGRAARHEMKDCWRFRVRWLREIPPKSFRAEHGFPPQRLQDP